MRLMGAMKLSKEELMSARKTDVNVVNSEMSSSY
jgi:hypothetical protein